MTSREVRPGRRVRIPWGLDHVEGTVIGVFGPPARQFARVQIELGDPDDEDVIVEVTLPVSLL